MSSDSEVIPSPLPSPVFARCAPARSTVARRCREFYLRRLERTTSMQKRWSLAESSVQVPVEGHQSSPANESKQELTDSEGSNPLDNVSSGVVTRDEEPFHPLRKSQSSLDLAMDSLRREISSLIAQDNDLFRQLLSLHDSIAELRERQRSRFALCPDDEDEDEEEADVDGDRGDSQSPSLESLSDAADQETSPDSTLSSRSSLSGTSSSPHHHHTNHHYMQHHHHHHHHHQRRKISEVSKKRYRSSTVVTEEPRPLVFIDRSEICFRCRKVPPPYRRSSSITSLHWLHDDMDSYDSGIHLQGSHSDSDHEIFV